MPRKFLFVFLIATALSPAILRAQTLDQIFDDDSELSYAPFVELNGYGADFPETGTTFLFAPLWQTEDEMFFADLRGLYNDLAEVEGNWGLGYRRIINDDTIFGVYGYYDQRFTEWNNRYHQATLGMELLRVENEARLNVYIPDDNQELAYADAFLQNNQLFVQGVYEAAYFGSDIEYGHLLYSNCCRDLEVRGYVGGYFFDRGEDGYESISGPRTRLEMRMYDLKALGNGSRLVVGGTYQHDDARGHQGIAYAGIRIALGQGPKLTGLKRRMVNPIVRDVDILTNVGGLGVRDPAKFASSGVMPSNIVTIDGNTVDPEGVFAASGANSLVIFNGDAGTILADSSFEFNNGQVALGGGSGIPLVGCETGLMATYYAPGSRPTVDGGANGITIFELDNNNAIIGLNIMGGSIGISSAFGGSYQIIGNNVTGAMIHGASFGGSITGDILYNHFDNNSGWGLFTNGSLTGDVIGNSFDGNNDGGLGVGLSSGSLTGNVTGNSFSDNINGDGLFVGMNLTGDVSGNHFDHNGGDGAQIDGELEGNVSNNTFDNNHDSGLNAQENLFGNVTGNSFSDNVNGYGLYVSLDLIGNVSDNHFNHNGSDGANTGDLQGNVSNNTFDHNQDAGLIVGGNLTGNVTGNSFSDNINEDGLNVSGNLTGDVSDNHFDHNGGDGASVGGDLEGGVSNNTFDHNNDTGLVVFGSLLGNVSGNSFSNNVHDDGLVVFTNLTGDVSDNHFDSNGSDGASIFGDLEGGVSNNTFDHNQDAGLVVFGSLTGNVTGSSFSDNVNDSGLIVFTNLTGDVSENHFDRNGVHGAQINGELEGNVSKNTFDHNQGDGLNAQENLIGNVTGNSFSDNVNGEGLYVSLDLTGNVLNNQFDRNGDDGINMGDVLVGTLFDNNTAHDNGGDGFDFGDNNGTFTNNTANDNGGMGFNGGTNNGTANNNTGINNTGGGNMYPP
jgi:hypothetical protein